MKNVMNMTLGYAPALRSIFSGGRTLCANIDVINIKTWMLWAKGLIYIV